MTDPRGTFCTSCGKHCVKRRCKAYHAQYMREWRKKQRAAFLAIKAVVDEMRRSA